VPVGVTTGAKQGTKRAKDKHRLLIRTADRAGKRR